MNPIEQLRTFPLVPIRDDDHLGRALTTIDGLLRQDLDEGSQKYLDALTALVEEYETSAYWAPTVEPHDMLRALINFRRCTPADVSLATGIAESVLSGILDGARPFTEAQTVSLAKFFSVAPSVFLPDSPDTPEATP